MKGVCLLQAASDVLLWRQAGDGLCLGLGGRIPPQGGAGALGVSSYGVALMLWSWWGSAGGSAVEGCVCI